MDFLHRSAVVGSSRRRGGGADLAFSLRVKTDNTGTSNDDQFTLPLTTGTYDYNVDWGDGTDDDFTVSTSQTHTYSVAGTYDIRITGTFPRIFFNNGGDKLKLLEILNWGEVGFEVTQTSAFYGCTNIPAIPGGAAWFDTVTIGNNMFRRCTSLTSLPEDMTLSALITGSAFFVDAPITSLPAVMTLPELVTATSMFNGCSSLASLPAGMTLAKLQSAGLMFNSCSALTSLPSGVKLSALTSGSNMFRWTTLATARYSTLLEDLESLNPNNSVTFHGGNSKYNSAGQTARNILTASPRLWSITDGGLET